MLFNSFSFAFFFIIVFFLYWFVFNKNLRVQNFLIVVSSYVFYGWWDWRFLFLITISSFVDYSIGIGLSKQDNPIKRRLLFSLSLMVNLGLLCFFKYYNFFVNSFVDAFSFFGYQLNITTLKIILPVGISFYTFQTISYAIEVYKKRLEPTRDILAFFAFICFFPQLVAGPIEKATFLLPQFLRKRFFNYNNAVDGFRQILWGLFKKVVVADNCAQFVNIVYNNSSNHSGSNMAFGVLLFCFQIYADFSGYSDIALGTSQLMGFRLGTNFRSPYFSKTVTEFWRRWHISLSIWFRDYVYNPLSIRFRYWGLVGIIFSTNILFLIIGLWHGAKWNFVFFGFLQGFAITYEILSRKIRKKLSKSIPSLFYSLISMLITFSFWTFSLVFFRSENIFQAFRILKSICSVSLFYLPTASLFSGTNCHPLTLIFLIILFVFIEWQGKEEQYAIEKLGLKWPIYARWAMYYVFIFCIFNFAGSGEQFIYFQF